MNPSLTLYKFSYNSSEHLWTLWNCSDTKYDITFTKTLDQELSWVINTCLGHLWDRGSNYVQVLIACFFKKKKKKKREAKDFVIKGHDLFRDLYQNKLKEADQVWKDSKEGNIWANNSYFLWQCHLDKHCDITYVIYKHTAEVNLSSQQPRMNFTYMHTFKCL